MIKFIKLVLAIAITITLSACNSTQNTVEVTPPETNQPQVSPAVARASTGLTAEMLKGSESASHGNSNKVAVTVKQQPISRETKTLKDTPAAETFVSNEVVELSAIKFESKKVAPMVPPPFLEMGFSKAGIYAMSLVELGCLIDEHHGRNCNTPGQREPYASNCEVTLVGTASLPGGRMSKSNEELGQKRAEVVARESGAKQYLAENFGIELQTFGMAAESADFMAPTFVEGDGVCHVGERGSSADCVSISALVNPNAQELTGYNRGVRFEAMCPK